MIMTTSYCKHRETCTTDKLTCDHEQCSFSTTKARDMKVHQSLHEIGLQCKECKMLFSTITKLQNHQNKVHKMKLSCESCSQLFASRKILNTHKKLKHSSDGLHKCETCGRRCLSESKLKRHQLIHSQQPVPKYFCAECGFRGVTKKEMNEHFKNIHPKQFVMSEKVADEWFQQGTCSNRGYLRLAKPLRYFQPQ